MLAFYLPIPTKIPDTESLTPSVVAESALVIDEAVPARGDNAHARGDHCWHDAAGELGGVEKIWHEF